MWYHSRNEMDAPFVKSVISQHKLDPSPKHGFHADPLYWQQNSRWRRVVEDYDWGCVVFLSDLKTSQHFTIIVVGSFDVSSGKVKGDSGRSRSIADIVPWYMDMSAELSTAHNSNNIDIPACFGFNEPDHVCIGGVNPNSKIVEPACAWLAKCAALRNAAESTGRTQQTILRGKSPDQIAQMSERLLTSSGKASKPRALTGKEQAKAVSTVVKSEKTSGRHTDFVAHIIRVMGEVAKMCNVGIAHDIDSAVPGELFAVDRTAKSDYVTVYQSTSSKSKKRPIAAWRIRTRDPGFRVQLPLEKGSDVLKAFVQADIVVWNDGVFKCCVNDVIPGQIRMDNIRNVMCHIVKAPI